jgi:uncharacterized protein (DUF1697 family)
MVVRVERYVAFLRGMNLGGRRIKNEQLREEFEALGLTEVACFRASGNVVFASEEGSEATLADMIEAGLSSALGYEVPVFLRDSTQIWGIAGFQPFDPEAVERSGGKLQVSLLAAEPPAKARKEVLSMASDEDLLAIDGRELYWLPSGGMLESSLDLDAIDALLGRSTRRTKGTIEQIAAKHFVRGLR